MALKAKSSFLWGLQVTTLNRSLDFRASPGGPVLLASLQLGFYSLTDLLNEIVRAMAAVDHTNTYTVTSNRSFANGTQNRTTFVTSGTYLDLLFGSGPRAASSCNFLLGFPGTDQTGALTYTGTSSAGTVLVPTMWGYNYLSNKHTKKAFGSLNISATGQKEAIVFQIQQFFQVQFKYEPLQFIDSDWVPFLEWAIQQKPFDFTPEITDPNTAYDVTLETTENDDQGLSYQLTEMLPEFPNLYDTGLMTFRLKVN